MRKYTFLQWFFNIFVVDQGPKMAPQRTPLGCRAPPRGPHGAQKKVCARPWGAPRGAQVAEKAPQETIWSIFGPPRAKSKSLLPTGATATFFQNWPF